jgi:hypothetical protein
LQIFAWTASFACADWVLEPRVERQFGAIEYDMDFPFPAGDFADGETRPTLQSYGRSLLVFPVDVFLAGLELRRENPSETEKNFYVSAATNWTDPQESMLDKDWIEAHGGSGLSSSKAYMLISDTRSRSKLSVWKVEAGQDFAKLRFKDRVYHIGWRVGFDHFSADIFGIQGWQGSKIGGILGEDYVVFDTLQDVKVLTYQAVYVSPGAYATTEWSHGRHFNLDLRCEISPATFAFDRDDHLLRGKNADSWAVGLDGEMEATLVWHASPIGQLKLGGKVGYTRTWGLMTQKFYGSGPEAAEANRQLQEVGDIHNSLNRFQYSIFLSAPFTFTKRAPIQPHRKGTIP